MSQLNLTPNQRQVVESDADAILVLANAGCGKTHVLTERVRFLLEHKRKSHALALTFTNKAAEEMEKRLTENIYDIRSKAFIGTIHSFCMGMIGNRGMLIGYPEMPHIFERDSDRRELLIQVIKNSDALFKSFQQKNEQEQNKFINDAMLNIGMKKKNLSNRKNNSSGNSRNNIDIDYLFQEYNDLLVSQNAIDYDDIILLAHKILIDNPKIAELYRKQYHYILIDEAQDLNFAQYEFIKALCGTEHRKIMMVGDPDQAIYGFNGSDKKYMVEFFPKDFSATILYLNENFRSSKEILKAANRLISNRSKIKINSPLNGLFEFQPLTDPQKEAEWIVEKIMYYLNHGHPDIIGKVTEDRIAVLGRTKYIFAPIEELLKKRQIPYFIKKPSDVTNFESEFVRMFDLGLRLLDNPKDSLHYRQLLNLLNCPDNEVIQTDFIEQLKIIFKHIPPNQKCIFEKLSQVWVLVRKSIANFAAALKQMKDFLEQKSEDERDITALEDIKEYELLWKQYCRQVAGESRTLSHFRSQIALGMPRNNKLQSGVTLGTIHSVKGLGFDIVFLMGMNEGTFPDYRSKNNPKALAEERNNAYVAMTRAKRLLFITYPQSKEMPWGEYKKQFPSRFIDWVKKTD